MPTPGKPYDATPRDLFDLGPADWPGYLRIAVPASARVEVIDSNVSTVTADADKVLRVVGEPSWIIHVEFQASRDPRMAERISRYHLLLAYKHRMLVRSTVVLLRPEAGGDELSGFYEMRFPGEDAHLTFRYDVVRAWERRAEDILKGGLATLPLVAISDVGTMGIVEALTAMSDRLAREAGPDQRAMLLTSARVMMGLNYDEAWTREIWKEIEMDVLKIRGIEASSTYQEILRKGKAKGMAEGKAKGMAEGTAKGKAEGKAEEAREILLRLGGQRFGAPSRQVSRRIAASGLEQLEGLLGRLLTARNWGELWSPDGPAD
jgi:predicted transposase YdaD